MTNSAPMKATVTASHSTFLGRSFKRKKEKIMAKKSEEERIAEFVAEFPSLECVAKGEAFYSWHHILTGSCKQGRDLFCSERGLSLEARYTIAEFIALTENAYGGEIIKRLKQHYDGKD